MQAVEKQSDSWVRHSRLLEFRGIISSYLQKSSGPTSAIMAKSPPVLDFPASTSSKAWGTPSRDSNTTTSMLFSAIAMTRQFRWRRSAGPLTGWSERVGLSTGEQVNGLKTVLLKLTWSAKDMVWLSQWSSSHNTAFTTDKTWKLNIKDFLRKNCLELQFGLLLLMAF